MVLHWAPTGLQWAPTLFSQTKPVLHFKISATLIWAVHLRTSARLWLDVFWQIYYEDGTSDQFQRMTNGTPTVGQASGRVFGAGRERAERACN